MNGEKHATQMLQNVNNIHKVKLCYSVRWTVMFVRDVFVPIRWPVNFRNWILLRLSFAYGMMRSVPFVEYLIFIAIHRMILPNSIACKRVNGSVIDSFLDIKIEVNSSNWFSIGDADGLTIDVKFFFCIRFRDTHTHTHRTGNSFEDDHQSIRW